MRSFVRANYRIRVPRVRCIDQNGNMIGVLGTREALRLAEQAGLDLVEISPNADPPVCRIMDYGKYKYQESLKEKEARKHQHAMVVKEIKFHSTISPHDLLIKVKHVREFLAKGFRVKLTLTFRGRENVHKEVGFEVINSVLKECQDIGAIEMVPRIMGHSIVAMLVGKRRDHVQQQPQREVPVVEDVQRPPEAPKNEGKSLDAGAGVP